MAFHDPHVESITLDDGPLEGLELSEERLREADVVVVVTNHTSYAWDEVARLAPLILDTRNALAGIEGRIVRL